MEARFTVCGVLIAVLASGCSADRGKSDPLVLDNRSYADELTTGSIGAIGTTRSHRSHAESNTGAVQNVIAVADDGGGRIVDYAIKTATLRDSQALVRFAGRCASACTIYLSLPPEQLCISPSVRFQFHKPTASTGRARAHAETYLHKVYPEWVRDWIAAQGGLGKNFITMNYHYAKTFLKSCEPVSQAADAAASIGDLSDVLQMDS